MKMEPIKSSNLSSVGYDVSKKELHVEFRGGGTYIYEDVPPHVHDGLLSADSPGSYLRTAIKVKGFKCKRAS